MLLQVPFAGDVVQHDTVRIEVRCLHVLDSVLSKHVPVDRGLVPIVRRPAEVAVDTFFVPWNVDQWAIVFMNSAKRVPEFVEDSSADNVLFHALSDAT